MRWARVAIQNFNGSWYMARWAKVGETDEWELWPEDAHRVLRSHRAGCMQTIGTVQYAHYPRGVWETAMKRLGRWPKAPEQPKKRGRAAMPYHSKAKEAVQAIKAERKARLKGRSP